MTRIRTTPLVALLTLGFLAPPAEAQVRAFDASSPRDLTARVERVRAEHDVPALGAALIVGDRLAALGVSGLRRLGSDRAVQADDRWHLGSCTKAMTATLAAIAVEQGRLEYDATIGSRLADAGGMLLPPLEGRLDPSWSTVTLTQLLHHVSGAPSGLTDQPALGLFLLAKAKDPVAQRRGLVAGLLREPVRTAPGTAFAYSNEGYVLAGALIERALGGESRRSYEELAREHLFGPLGMASAGFGPPGSAGRDEPPDQPEGHLESGKPVGRGLLADNQAAYAPAGTVHASLEDWARFIALHLAAERELRAPEAERARPLASLPAEAFVVLHGEGPIGDYGMGWIVAERPWARGSREDDHGRVLTHTGSNTMWFAAGWIPPERDFAALAVCNQGPEAPAQACDAIIGELVVKQAAELDAAGAGR